MLEFWALRPNESAEMVDGAIEYDPNRKPEFSIEIAAFHRILDNGLTRFASEIGLSYFDDVLIDEKSSQKILNILMEIDKRLNPSGARTENRVMAEFFSNAVSQNLKVVVVCD